MGLKSKYPTYALILAGGVGKRFNNGKTPKQLIKIGGEPIIYYTIRAFENHPLIDKIIIVGNGDSIEKYKEIVKENDFSKVIKVIEGGPTRQESTKKGLDIIPIDHKESKILIHDAVRPFLSDSIISDIILELDKSEAVDVAIPIADTIIEVNNSKFISSFPIRSSLMRGQTPQGFKMYLIKKAHEMATKDIYNSVTDDCGLIFKLKLNKIKVIDGEEKNIKITYPIDIHLADKIFQVFQQNFDNKEKLDRKNLNKNIVVIGHTGGIGKEIYNLSLKTKSKVIGFSKSTGFDVTNIRSIEKIANYFKGNKLKIDFLFITIGELLVKPFKDNDFEEINRIINVNFTSQIILLSSLLPFIKNGGSIILFTSSSYTRGRKNYSLYSSSKAAIANFVQALGDELLKDNIKINAICPTRTNTPMRFKNFGQEDPSTLLSPEYVAEQSLLVADSNLTGQIINIRKND